MGKFLHTQNSFSAGEISPEFFARSDISALRGGCARLENMTVLPSSAITKRPGLVRVAEIPADAILCPFTVSDDESYLLALVENNVQIYKNDSLTQELPAPWSASEIRAVQYVQRFDTMIFVHENHPPQVLKKTGIDSFSLSDFYFAINDDFTRNMPFMKFDDAANIRLSMSAHSYGNNYATITTNEDFWTPENEGGLLMMIGKQFSIYQYINPRTIVASAGGQWSMQSSITDWYEAAFSTRRGWPRSISFHQDRLVFGGSKSWPCGLWLSKTGQHNDFSTGTGLDDDAIFITLLSDQRQQIQTVVSSDNLQILTSVGEWAISSHPLTPSSMSIKQHTNIGSAPNLAPQKVEGSTIFVSNGGREISELILDQLGENYNAVNLCALSKHLMNNPVSIAYDESNRQLFVPMQDGSMAVLFRNPALSISAWGSYKTQGEFKSTAVSSNNVYVVVKRDENSYLEKFSASATNDSGEFRFYYAVAALPLLVSGHGPKKLRLMKLSARLLESKGLTFKVNADEYVAKMPNEIYSADHSGFSGDISVSILGTDTDSMQPLWEISGNDELPLTILSITAEGRYSI